MNTLLLISTCEWTVYRISNHSAFVLGLCTYDVWHIRNF